MSYALGGGWNCDGCQGHIPLEAPTPVLHFPVEERFPRHYHQACWQTGWYTGIEPKGEWPMAQRCDTCGSEGDHSTPDCALPTNLPGGNREPVFDHIKREPLGNDGLTDSERQHFSRVFARRVTEAMEHPFDPSVFAGEAKAGPLAEPLTTLFDEIGAMMEARHEKYGPGNIAEFGDVGILVRMADKFARLKNGQRDHADETVHNTLDDIIGYALIWKMWLNGDWPGSRDNGNKSPVG